MVPNIKICNFANAHVAAVSYGFAPNGDPVPGFHNHVLQTMVKDEDNPFFISKNVGQDSLVELVDCAGDVIVIPAVTTRGTWVGKKPPRSFFSRVSNKTPPSLTRCLRVFLRPSTTPSGTGQH